METTKKPRTPVSTKDRRSGERTRWDTIIGAYFVLFPLAAGLFLTVEAAQANNISRTVPAQQTVMAVAP